MKNISFRIDEINVNIVLKYIKNIYVRVYPKNNLVKISAPMHTDPDYLRNLAYARVEWARKHCSRLRKQINKHGDLFTEGSTHYVWGRPFKLKLIVTDQAPSIKLSSETMILSIRQFMNSEKIRGILEKWYRTQIKEAAVSIVSKWEPFMGVKVKKLFVRKMKTKWGSCNYRDGNIRLNTDLAKMTPECLEYVVVHEMTHLLEPKHNRRFKALMDGFLPEWKKCRVKLNQFAYSTD